MGVLERLTGSGPEEEVDEELVQEWASELVDAYHEDRDIGRKSAELYQEAATNGKSHVDAGYNLGLAGREAFELLDGEPSEKSWQADIGRGAATGGIAEAENGEATGAFRASARGFAEYDTVMYRR